MAPMHCLRSVFATALVGAVLIAPALPGPSQAQQSAPEARPELLTRLVACREQTEAGARLACYDTAAAALDSAEREGEVVVIDRAQVTVARRQMFGFDLPSMPDIFERGARVESMASIETTLTRASMGAQNSWLFTLADGSVWRSVDTSTPTFSNRAGQAVRVRRASMGSYMMSVANGPGFRVRRQ